MNTNEQYEPCALEEATHARTATGYVSPLSTPRDGSAPYIKVRSVGWHVVPAPAFPVLGITPVRKAEVKPVEFVGKAETLEDICFESVTIIKVPAEYEGKTFRCVEVQP